MVDQLQGHEVKFLEFLEAEVLPSTPLIYDVGANEGQFAVECMRLWPEAQLRCFEPVGASYMELAKNTKRWQDQIKLSECALWNEKDLIPLYHGMGCDQTASLFSRWLPGVGELHKDARMVQVHRLDEFMMAFRETPVNLIKLDVEGAEFRVLQGAGTFLDPKKIEAIWFELNSCALDARVYFRDFWNLLRSRGYSISEMTSSGDPEPIEEYDAELENFAAHREFLAW